MAARRSRLVRQQRWCRQRRRRRHENFSGFLSVSHLLGRTAHTRTTLPSRRHPRRRRRPRRWLGSVCVPACLPAVGAINPVVAAATATTLALLLQRWPSSPPSIQSSASTALCKWRQAERAARRVAMRGPPVSVTSREGRTLAGQATRNCSASAGCRATPPTHMNKRHAGPSSPARANF